MNEALADGRQQLAAAQALTNALVPIAHALRYEQQYGAQAKLAWSYAEDLMAAGLSLSEFREELEPHLQPALDAVVDYDDRPWSK